MIYPELPRLALSIRQPWTWAILHAGKDVENRDWPTKVRGPICLHASAGMTHDEYEDFCLTTLGAVMPKVPPFNALVRGGIVGVAAIVDCVTTARSPWFFGRYGFVLADCRSVPFIAVKGKLGFFDWRERLIVSASSFPRSDLDALYQRNPTS